MFKVGDRVEVVEGEWNNTSGLKGIVISIDDPWRRIKFDNGVMYNKEIYFGYMNSHLQSCEHLTLKQSIKYLFK